jgi:D-alanyl-D-alanine carboxypeptidase
VKSIVKNWKFIVYYILLIAAAVFAFPRIRAIMEPKIVIAGLEQAAYDNSLVTGELLAGDLCVTVNDVNSIEAPAPDGIYGAGVFDLNAGKVLFSYKLHDRLFPASTTKMMTALLAFEKGNLSEEITVGDDAVHFAADESVSSLKYGDVLSMEELIYGLMLPSGNDAAVVIADNISGSVTAFSDLMNEKSKEIYAVHSHFVNPNGLHDENHYTTVYDLYLILNACMKESGFSKVVNTKKYIAEIVDSSGVERDQDWGNSNFFISGKAQLPTEIHVIGGKTGTTGAAGNCLALYWEDSDNNPYITIVMGAYSKEYLYNYLATIMKATLTSKGINYEDVPVFPAVSQEVTQ